MKNTNKNNLNWPIINGWYWVLFDGYDSPRPCSFENDENGGYFLPGGMGDSSSMGLYEEDITRVGPMITEPKF